MHRTTITRMRILITIILKINDDDDGNANVEKDCVKNDTRTINHWNCLQTEMTLFDEDQMIFSTMKG